MTGRCAGERGFTLVEVVVAVSIFSLVVGAALALYQQAVLSWHKDEARVDVQESLRIALERMSGEIRSARELVEAGESRIGLAVIEPGGDSDNATKYIYYYLDSAQKRLVRELDGKKDPAAGHVTAFQLAYYDENDHRLEGQLSGEELKKVRRVEITLTGRKGSGPEVRITTSVRVRALD
ncbi:type II secretion system protein [Thermosediminibacter litoriperuensis]|uniref:Prepilin-type N-terminal cleavage/methylation domain-containing protein n=1 Tax=Thermosediminibacter litoriperuensis TaxID=291989 RepID=A0A5S5ANQ9_9FIRM|nr:type II secretion system protein [Thermosediminibacter litoriperuensis]TYP53296.1 prepilin-type N-terminal cleavage/methylation domain-containing protein [Thermosediminibacter litoriperuensis]